MGAVLMGESSADPRGRRGQAHRPHHVGAGGRGDDRPRGQRAGPAHRRQGPDRHHGLRRRSRCIAPGVVDRQPVREPLETGIKADRRMVQHRPRPARADHRRPPDRQDRDRDRHDHQPEGQGRRLHLRGHRPEALDGRAGGEDARGLRGHGAHHRGVRHRLRPRALPLHRRPTRAAPSASTSATSGQHALCIYDDLSQARRRLPRDLAAAAPSAGTRGLSGRRLLPAQPPARARGQALRQEGRGQPDRASPSSRRRRATSPPTSRPTSSRSPTARSSWSRDLFNSGIRPAINVGNSVSRVGRLRAGEGDEGGGRPPAPGPRAVPRAGRLRHVRLRPGQGHAGACWPGASA